VKRGLVAGEAVCWVLVYLLVHLETMGMGLWIGLLGIGARTGSLSSSRFRLAQKKARLLINNQLNWLANEGLDWQIDIDHLVNI